MKIIDLGIGFSYIDSFTIYMHFVCSVNELVFQFQIDNFFYVIFFTSFLIFKFSFSQSNKKRNQKYIYFYRHSTTLFFCNIAVICLRIIRICFFFIISQCVFVFFHFVFYHFVGECVFSMFSFFFVILINLTINLFLAFPLVYAVH